MRKSYGRKRKGSGKVWGFILVIFIAAIIIFGLKVFSTEAPVIKLSQQIKGIGKQTAIEFTVRDQEYPLKSVNVDVQQGNRTFPVSAASEIHNAPSPPWWKFWAGHATSSGSFKAQIGHDHIPDLKEGRATLEIVATNNSWGHFFKGGKTKFRLDLPVQLRPPQIEDLSGQIYVAQGGCNLVIFKVSPGTTRSGVQVGKYFFRSYPVKPSLHDTRMCLFAYPYNMNSKTAPSIVASDEAGNKTVSTFSCTFVPQKFRQRKLVLDKTFLARAVPAILSHTPQLHDQGSLVKNFLMLDTHLATIDSQLLLAYSQKTARRFLWKGPFVRLPNSEPEAHFGDRRTFSYQGKFVDHEVHFGYDLASVAHAPIPAANSGVVVFARYFGIYGNSILIDHGCGLQTLYGHLSSFAVKPGQHVTRGQIIGHTGKTGLAEGDHLHFSVLVDGVFVNPLEWWDPNWIRTRITSKLAAYQSSQ